MFFLYTLEITAVMLFGMILGSFATALVSRIPVDSPWFIERDENDRFVFSRSACPHCGHTLAVKDLIPVLSWFRLNGKCRYCAAGISREYPLTELMSVFACLGIYFVWGLTGQGVFLYATVPFLIALFIIDMRHMILPDILNVILGGLAVMFLVYQMLVYGSSYGYDRIFFDKLAGLAVFPAVAWLMRLVTTRLLNKDSMGLGDIKFFAVAGIWLGLSYLPYFLITGGILGVLTGILFLLKGKKGVFPFGPALILALYFGFLLRGLEINPFM